MIWGWGGGQTPLCALAQRSPRYMAKVYLVYGYLLYKYFLYVDTAVAEVLRHPLLTGRGGSAPNTRFVYVAQFAGRGAQRFCKHPFESVVGSWVRSVSARACSLSGCRGSCGGAACARMKTRVRRSKASEADKAAAQGDRICSQQQNMSLSFKVFFFWSGICIAARPVISR
jgi:hypothetical protein